MIERATWQIEQPLSNSDRKRLYLARLVMSPLYDEHDYARRVSDGLAVLSRLQARWRYLALLRKGDKNARPTLVLIRRKA
jgi:hypothetical protein